MSVPRGVPISRTLEIGTLPLVLDSDSPEETLRAYVQLYLREEMKGGALVRNLPGFALFLPIAALFHGQVDIVLRRGKELCAIEVKSTARHNVRHLAGLRAMAGLPNLRRRVLVFRSDRPFRTEDGIDVWPIAEFLSALHSGVLWP